MLATDFCRAGFSRPVQRRPLRQLARVCWSPGLLVSGLVLTIDFEPCEAASHHVGSLTQIPPEPLTVPGSSSSRSIHAGLDLEHHQAGFDVALPPMPTYPNLPSSAPDLRSHVPEDLARYATGRRPLSNTPKLMRPTSSLGSHAEPTKALLRARPHGSRMGAVVVGRGTAHLSSRNRARAGQLTGSLCPPARCWRCSRVSLLTSNLTLHICYFALPPFHTDCRTGRQNIVGFA